MRVEIPVELPASVVVVLTIDATAGAPPAPIRLLLEADAGSSAATSFRRASRSASRASSSDPALDWDDLVAG